MSRTLLLIDGSSLLHRAFYALPLLKSTNGQYTNAVYGFTNMLVKLLIDGKPDAILVAFDKGKATFRNEVYTAYKAQRKATPPELAEQFPTIREVLAAMGIAVFEEAGFEADDIIGTFAAKASAAGYQVEIVTGDRDALQLINPSTRVLLTRKGITEVEVIDEAALKEKYGLSPEQIIDLKGLMGDTSDNIPGVPGIGEKTAGKLLAEFGSVENVLANIAKVSGAKLQENLRTHAELALLSKRLATIIRDLPLPFEPEKAAFQPDVERVRELFTQLEFKSLLNRLGEFMPGVADAPVEVAEHLPEAQVLTEAHQVASFLEEAQSPALLACYPFLAGNKPPVYQASGMGLATPYRAVYIPCSSAGWEEAMVQLRTRGAGVVYDSKLYYNWNGEVNQEDMFDISLAAYLLNPTTSDYSLTSLSENYLGHRNYWREKEVAGQPAFAAWAAATMLKLRPVMEEALREAQLWELYQTIELPLAKVLSAMEMAGITVDREHLHAISSSIARRVDELLADIYALAGEEFNVNSTRQLGVILFEKLKLPVIKKTKTGYSTDAEVLEKLAGEHPLIDKLLEYRLLAKLKSTYLDAMDALISPQTGRIHSNFNQAVTATGRLSSSDPNLQNIPIRTEAGRQIRELFVPGAGYDYLLSADYSQIELRILAHLSDDKNLVESFLHNEDVHTRTAAEVFGVAMADVTSEMRARAKAVNFGIVYGISDYGLARDLGVTRKEAGHYIDSYFSKYQGVKAYIDNIVADARRDGFVTTMLGRRRHLPDINSSNFNQRSFAERTAMNTPIQGTAADIIKKAMIDVHKALVAGGMKTRVLLQVHDELVLEVPAAELEQAKALVKTCMENALVLKVPLSVDVKYGKNWAEAK